MPQAAQTRTGPAHKDRGKGKGTPPDKTPTRRGSLKGNSQSNRKSSTVTKGSQSCSMNIDPPAEHTQHRDTRSNPRGGSNRHSSRGGEDRRVNAPSERPIDMETDIILETRPVSPTRQRAGRSLARWPEQPHARAHGPKPGARAELSIPNNLPPGLDWSWVMTSPVPTLRHCPKSSEELGGKPYTKL